MHTVHTTPALGVDIFNLGACIRHLFSELDVFILCALASRCKIVEQPVRLLCKPVGLGLGLLKPEGLGLGLEQPVRLLCKPVGLGLGLLEPVGLGLGLLKPDGLVLGCRI